MNKTNKEYLTVLKDFSEQLKTQSYDGNTERLPTYWMVQKRERIWHIDPYEADGVLMGFYGEEKMSVEDFKASVEERIKETFEDPDKVTDYCDELEGLKDFDEIKNFCDEIRDYYAFGTEWEVELIGYNVRWRDVRNEMFLTKRDAKEYIRKFDYRFTEDEKPLRTYAYVAEDSPDLSSLIDALKNIDWEKINIVSNLSLVKSIEDRPRYDFFLISVIIDDEHSFYVKVPVEEGLSEENKVATIDDWMDHNIRENIVREHRLSWEFANHDCYKFADDNKLYYHIGYLDGSIVFVPNDQCSPTDDEIYEWVSERFENTNYIIV